MPDLRPRSLHTLPASFLPSPLALPQPRRLALGAAGLGLAALMLPGCGSTPPRTTGPATQSAAPGTGTAPAAGAGSPPPAAALAADGLAVERRWLQQWFDGTPVLIAQPQRDALAVEVPRDFCFDKGSATVKPPLKAVLDKLALSLRRQPQARLARLAAPADAGGDSTLARQRAQRVREHLRSRGVPAERLGEPTATTAAAVQLRVQG